MSNSLSSLLAVKPSLRAKTPGTWTPLSSMSFSRAPPTDCAAARASWERRRAFEGTQAQKGQSPESRSVESYRLYAVESTSEKLFLNYERRVACFANLSGSLSTCPSGTYADYIVSFDLEIFGAVRVRMEVELFRRAHVEPLGGLLF